MGQQTVEQERTLGITRDDKRTYAKPISSTCRSSSDQDGDSYYHQCLDRWKHAWADGTAAMDKVIKRGKAAVTQSWGTLSGSNKNLDSHIFGLD